MILAAAQGNLMQVKRLLDAGADVNAKDRRGNTALIEASFDGAIELVELLLARGADITARNQSGDTAVTEAARLGNAELMKLLLSKPVGPAAKQKLTAVYKALAQDPEEISPEILRSLKDCLFRKNRALLAKTAQSPATEPIGKGPAADEPRLERELSPARGTGNGIMRQAVERGGRDENGKDQL